MCSKADIEKFIGLLYLKHIDSVLRITSGAVSELVAFFRAHYSTREMSTHNGCSSRGSFFGPEKWPDFGVGFFPSRLSLYKQGLYTPIGPKLKPTPRKASFRAGNKHANGN